MSRTEPSNLSPTTRDCHDALVMPLVPYGHEDSTTRGGPFGRWLGGVYCEGAAVPEALAVRFIETTEQGWQYVPHRCEKQAPALPATKRYSGQYIYCGRLIDQFGHFILESLARIWLARKHPEWTLVWTGADGYRAWQQEILEVLGIRNPACFVQHPSEFERLVIPSAGYILSTFYAPYFLDSLGSVAPKPVIPGRKVYVSRSRSGTGGFVNETAIDELLAAHGWSILYPEEMRVAERFDLLSSAEVILMIQGAAFVPLVMFSSLQSRVVTLTRSDTALFDDRIWFTDFFDAIAHHKGFDYHRLELPLQHVYGGDHAARYALDMQVFTALMEQTHYLSGPLHALATYQQASTFDPAQAQQLAEQATSLRDTTVSQTIEHAYRSGLSEASADLKQACQEARLATSANPHSAYLQGVLARLLAQQGEWAEAENAMRQAIALDAYDTPGNHIQLLHICANQGKLEQAIQAGEAALRLDADAPGCWLGLANVLMQSQKLDEAQRAFEKTLALNAAETQVDAYFGLSHLFGAKSDLQAALHAIQQAIALDAHRPELHHHSGVILHSLGDLQGAEAAQRKALELDADFSAAKQQLIEIQHAMALSQSRWPILQRLRKFLSKRLGTAKSRADTNKES